MRFIFLALIVLVCVPARAEDTDLVNWLQARVSAIPGYGPAFIASYDVVINSGGPGKSDFDAANANAAYTYDEALAIMALLAAGDVPRARRLGEALVYAQSHDRFWHDGRLRNAYLAGPVGEGDVKLPGQWNAEFGRWQEDAYQAGSAAGNNAWAGIALMRLYDATGDRSYKSAAQKIGAWLQSLPDAAKGIPGGTEGFEPHPAQLTWRSIEHNIAALALFRLLAEKDAARSTQAFIESLWSSDHFAVGTLADGVTINRAYSSLDAQVLALLALNAPDNYRPALAYAVRTHGVASDKKIIGFSYSDAKDGIWAEGTAEAADLYQLLGDKATAQTLLGSITAHPAPGGGIYAVQGDTSPEQLSTGLALGNGEGAQLYYYRRVALAPAAWAIMAARGCNPLAMAK
jgi:hypothetical protein